MLIDRCFSHLLEADATATDPTERRASLRVPIEVDVVIDGGGDEVTGLSANLATGGICISAYCLLPQGARLSVRFRLPTGSPVVGRGVVRWTRTWKPGRLPTMGIELVEIDAIDREAPLRFCDGPLRTHGRLG